jgi:hypothetical protein
VLVALAVGYWTPRRVLMLGSAAGSVARAFGHYLPRTRFDAVEIDPELTELGRRYFDLRNARMAENTLLTAGEAPVSPRRLREASRSMPVELQRLAQRVAGRLAPRLPGGEVYTDDRAPVEWLVDRSILRYASER